MKITIIAIGSRGDVQPYIALGKGLQSSGHNITIATHGIFQKFVDDHGLNFSRIHTNPKDWFEHKSGQDLFKHDRNIIKTLRSAVKILTPLWMEMGADCIRSCKDAEGIIYSFLGGPFGEFIAEKFKLPVMAAHLQPNHPTRYFPSWIFPIQQNLGPILNRFSHHVFDFSTIIPMRSTYNQWRKEQLDLPPIPINFAKKFHQRHNPALYGFSSHVVPKPMDWRDNIHLTGYWFLDDLHWKPSKKLVNFLEQGSPPIYVGFGSMNYQGSPKLTQLILQSLEATGQRGILAKGWGDISSEKLPDNVFLIDYAPHEWLFPRTAAVIHHGGAGTTSAGLRAGVPSIITPFIVDQHFWGNCVFHLGVGAKPIPFKKLNYKNLTQVIMNVVNNKDMIKRSKKLGHKIREEDGVGRGVKLVNRYLWRQ